MEEKSKNVRMILLSQIVPDPDQPRRSLRGIESMQRSLAAERQINPIIVIPFGGNMHKIVDGERRYEGAKRLGWKKMACIVEEFSSGEKVRDVQFHANFFRDALGPFELADELVRLMERKKWTEAQLAELIGWSRPTVASTLGLGKVPAEIRERLSTVCASVAREKLFHVARAASIEEMNMVVDQILSGESIGEIREARRSKKKVAAKAINGSVTKPTSEGTKANLSTKEHHDREEDAVVVTEPPGSVAHDAKLTSVQEPTDVTAVSPPVRTANDEAATPDGNAVDRSNATTHDEETPDSEGSLRATEPSHAVGLTTEERVVQFWWETFSCHAVRVEDLKNLPRDPKVAKLDVARWLKQAQGTVIGGCVVVSIPVVQAKRVYQLVPVEQARPDYLATLRGRLAKKDAKIE